MCGAGLAVSPRCGGMCFCGGKQQLQNMENVQREGLRWKHGVHQTGIHILLSVRCCCCCCYPAVCETSGLEGIGPAKAVIRMNSARFAALAFNHPCSWRTTFPPSQCELADDAFFLSSRFCSARLPHAARSCRCARSAGGGKYCRQAVEA
jgi:hypothetical protein